MRDRTGQNERTLHTVIPMALAALGWMLVTASDIGWIRILGLVFGSVGAFTAMAVFWALAAPMLSRKTRPVAIALISPGGVLGSALTPLVVGYLRDLTGSFDAGLWYAAALLAAGIVVLFVCGSRTRRHGGPRTDVAVAAEGQ